ncbi:VLP3p-1 [Venturia canescens]|uniref:VLP3p-1 n=1 Tax=Venturia canescens TaxID=32260 RepID=A0ACB9ZHU7_9HYME|nr:neprilysin-2-like [Venturia canescens]KAI5630642.1 VLP3p-1 [Venturia canescens]
MMGVKFLAIVVLLAVTANIILLVSTSPLKNEKEDKSDALGGRGTRNVIQTVYKSGESENQCNSPGCIHAASRILLDMDPEVNPCDDFYRFVCGGFLNRTVIPDDKTQVNAFSVIEDELQEKIRKSIEAEYAPGEPKPFRLVKTLYNSCMDKTTIEAKGLEPLRAILKKLGGWPVLDGDLWNDGDFDWKNSVYKFRDAGYYTDYFLFFGIGLDFTNNTNQFIDLDQASLGLPREYLSMGFEDKIVAAYYSYMVDVAVILGAPRDRAEKELKESLRFEMKLANISLPNEKRRNFTELNNPMTLTELTDKFPSIPWKEYFSRMLPSSITIEKDEVVIVEVVSYISDFEKLINETPKRVQANYAMWRAVADSVTYLNDDIRKRQLAYSTALSGKTERESRWKECVGIVSQDLSISVGAMYVRRYFNEDARKSAAEMVTDLGEQFTKILKTVDWMDEKTRGNALEKAASMSTHIAYPDELLDDDKLEKYYESLELSESNYLESILNIRSFQTKYSFSQLRKPFNKTDWLSHGSSAVVNAFYAPFENSIQFPAGILQGAFFDNDRPKYMNYGAIGFVIGHEITHGFDSEGRQFDKNGNLVDWWEPSTRENYLKRASCIVDQYANYTVEKVGLKLNGINTQGENIADNGGIKEAYLAYNSWVERNGPEAQLPGINKTSQQMFWISAANSWCSVYRPEALKLQITTNVHSPSEFRILGAFSNMPEFSKDFNCPLGSKMNPEKKCSVW